MSIEIENSKNVNKMNYISHEDILLIVRTFYADEHPKLESYFIDFASKNMLGFLCDYLKLNICVMLDSSKEKKVINCFIKSISKCNAAKAAMVKELKLFEKELRFYRIIKETIYIPAIKPWSPKLIVALKDSMVFENLISLGYKMHTKLTTFDEAHTFQALRTLARFHASTIIYEETKSKELNRPYSVNEEFETYLNKGGYTMTDPWFVQCMNAALDVIKSHSKYADNKDVVEICEKRWSGVWKTGLDLTDFSKDYRNVICHRDLWNNNLLFHYNDEEPDDCLLVDFQAVRCHPLAGDIMLLLYCNLESCFREKNIYKFLDYYYLELESLLRIYKININDIITLADLYKSANEYRLWALIVSACLVPQFWIDDDLTTEIFTDSTQFNEILSNDKASFIKRMIDENDSYRYKVLEIFENIVAQYILS